LRFFLLNVKSCGIGFFGSTQEPRIFIFFADSIFIVFAFAQREKTHGNKDFSLGKIQKTPRQDARF